MIQSDLRVYIIRHGQAEANRPWLFLGRTDSPLSEAGRQQAQALAKLLVGQPVDALYTSPLLRAQQTADVLADALGIPATKDERLIEQDYGAWEGLTLDQIETQHPEDFAAWQRGGPASGPTAGETLWQVSARAQACYAALRDRHPAGSVAVVAHGSVLNALMCHLFQIPNRWLWPFRLDTGTLSEVWVYGQDATLVAMNRK